MKGARLNPHVFELKIKVHFEANIE